MTIRMQGSPVEGRFLERPNRFQAIVEVEGRKELVHVPNTGRMDEMLFPGTPVWLEKSDNPNRKHRYSLKFVNKKGHWICIHSALANRVFEEAARSGEIDWVDGELRREVRFGDSRVDFQVDGRPSTLVEVKCVTYEEKGVAMFPDAPNQRGQKHVDELIRATEEGYRATIVFVVFMDFVHRFQPHDRIDPVFGEKLRRARLHGVDMKAYICRLDWNNIRIDRELPVFL